MNVHVLRSLVALAIGVPFLPACREAPPPKDGAGTEVVPVAAVPRDAGAIAVIDAGPPTTTSSAEAVDASAGERPRSCPPNMYLNADGVCRHPMRGRPLREEGRLVVAAPEARTGWNAEPLLAPEALAALASALSPSARAYAAAAWEREAAAEHASVAAFARLSLDLLRFGAPAHLVDAAHVAAREEIRHAELAYALASAFAEAPVGPAGLRLGSSGSASDLAAFAVACFEDGCIAETAAALEAAHARAAADARIAPALAVVAEDEGRHAALSFRIVAWALEAGGAEVRAALAVALAAAEAEAAAEPGAPEADPPGFAPDLGVLARAEAARVRRDALREVVLPAARALVGQTTS